MQIPSSKNVCFEFISFRIIILVYINHSSSFCLFFTCIAQKKKKIIMHMLTLTEILSGKFEVYYSKKQSSSCYWMIIVNVPFPLTCLQDLEDPKTSLTENDPIPLNEYRRNKLTRLSEMLRNKRDRFDEDLEGNWWIPGDLYSRISILT